MNDRNTMLRELDELGGVLQAQLAPMQEAADKLIASLGAMRASKILLLGCGDSYIAAKGVELALMRMTGIETQAVTAMDAARYLAPALMTKRLEDWLVIGLSHSGETARVLEAISRLGNAGAQTLAVVANAGSRLEGLAQHSIHLDVRTYPDSPCINSCLLMQMQLLLLAVGFAKRAGREPEQTEAYQSEICQIPRLITQRLQQIKPSAADFAKRFANCDEMELLGCGPSLSSALFGAAKLLEATGDGCLAINAEEFLHLYSFRANPKRIATVLLKREQGAADSRLQEVERVLRHLGRPLLMLSEDELSEIFTSPLFAAEIALVIALLDGSVNEAFYRGHLGVWDEEQIPCWRMSKVELS